MDLEHEKRLTEVEARSKSNAHRLDEVERRQNNLDKIAGAVEALAVREESVEADVKEIKKDVKEINCRPAKMWQSLVERVVWAVAAAVVGFLLAKIGL